MREILFRGKQRYNGEWIISGNVFFGESLKYMYFSNPNNDPVENAYVCREVIPETVGQYTGLTDRNGKKIFEGDIVRAMMDFGPAGFYERIVSIEWLNDVGYQWQYFDISTIEVIGNIHDNPELLKGGADNA